MKKNAFTLIELLAVIVILAIIALIATPIVLNIISDTKESANLRSAEMYLGAVETAVAKEMMEDTTFKPTSCEIQDNGNLKCDGIDVKVEINGEKPTSGTITLDQGKIQNIELVLSEKTIVKNTEGKLVYEEPPVPLQSGLYDADGNLIATWDELVNDYGIDVEKNYGDNDTLAPGRVLSSNDKLSKGVKLIIDNSVTKIGTNVFRNGTSLTEVIIAESVTAIGQAAFAHNTILEKISIPNSVTNIGASAFYGCIVLKKIIIPNSVTSIEHYTFYNCTSLKEIILPNSVTSIGANAFYSCTSLTKITLPNSVTHIGESAFRDCKSLKEIIIPNSITSIAYRAFVGCTSLTEITIPDSVTSISGDAFHSCSNLTSITIPNSVTSIGNYAFYNCHKLDTINYVGTQEEWGSIQFEASWNQNMASDYVINYNYVVQ